MDRVVSPPASQNPLLADLGKGNDVSSWLWRLPVKHAYHSQACTLAPETAARAALLSLSCSDRLKFLGQWI